MPPPVRATSSWRPLALFLAGLACVGAALVEARRSARATEEIVQRSLLGYARFAVWSYREHLSAQMDRAFRELLGAVNHGDAKHVSPRIPPAAELGEYLHFSPTCNCHRPDLGPVPMAFYGFTIGADTVGVGANYADPAQRGWLSDPPPAWSGPTLPVRLPPEEGRWLATELTRVARQGMGSEGYWLQVIGGAQDPRFVVATLMPTAWGDTLLYAAEYSREALDAMLTGVMEDPALLPIAPSLARERGGEINRQVLSLQVETPTGTSLLAWAVPEQWTFPAASALPLRHGGLLLQAEIQRASAAQLVTTGLPPSRWPLLVALTVVAALLTLAAAVQQRREMRFTAARSDFIASVSHELRTPLTQIRLMLDTMRAGRREEPAARAAALEMIDREVLRLQHLTEGVLRFARGEANGEAPTPERLDVGRELERIVAEFEPLASARGMRLSLESVSDVVVRAQPGAIRQTVINLLDNAVKYGPDGQTIRVRVEPGDASVAIVVEDEGPGVRAEERDRIWNPYQRGAAAADRAAGGSGIGLTVVRQIAANHGGSSSVRRRDDGAGGACFEVRFPRVPT